MSVTSKVASQNKLAYQAKAQQKPVADSKPTTDILERVKAFVELRFTPVIQQVALEKDEDEKNAMQMEQMLDLIIFYLGEIKTEDAVEFIQVCFQHLHRKKLQDGGIQLPPIDDEPDWLRLIRFKPTHKSFHHLQ